MNEEEIVETKKDVIEKIEIDTLTVIISHIRLPRPGESPNPIAMYDVVTHGVTVGGFSIPLLMREDHTPQKLGAVYNMNLKLEAITKDEFHRRNGFKQYPKMDNVKVM